MSMEWAQAAKDCDVCNVITGRVAFHRVGQLLRHQYDRKHSQEFGRHQQALAELYLAWRIQRSVAIVWQLQRAYDGSVATLAATLF